MPLFHIRVLPFYLRSEPFYLRSTIWVMIRQMIRFPKGFQKQRNLRVISA